MKTSFYTGKIEDESAIYFDADHFNISNDGSIYNKPYGTAKSS